MKYYVDYGGLNLTISSGNQYQACIRALYIFLDDRFVDTLPATFRVSQRGYDIHDDDAIIELELIVRLLVLNEQFIQEKNSKDGNGGNNRIKHWINTLYQNQNKG